MIPKLRVRRRRTDNKTTYRFTKGNVNWSKSDMEKCDGFEFDFAPSMGVEDRIAVCKQWAHKQLLPEHRLCYVDSCPDS